MARFSTGAPDASWVSIGEHSNAEYFIGGPRLLIAWPQRGAVDTESSAKANSTFQRDYFREQGTTGVVAIYFDRMASQDRAARKVYTEGTSADWCAGIALIGGTMLTRAMGSFFMGLSQPSVPIRMFASLDDASSWIDARLQGSP